MERDVGIREGSTLSGQELERRRKAQGADRRRIYAELLNERYGAGTVPTEGADSFQVLAQPEFEDHELYMKSILDLVRIVCRVALRRRVVSGRELVDRFDQTRAAVKSAFEEFMANAENKTAWAGAWDAAITAWGLAAGYASWAASAITLPVIGGVAAAGIAAGGIGWALYMLVVKMRRKSPEVGDAGEAI
jgi:hypothetical protein